MAPTKGKRQTTLSFAGDRAFAASVEKKYIFPYLALKICLPFIDRAPSRQTIQSSGINLLS